MKKTAGSTVVFFALMLAPFISGLKDPVTTSAKNSPEQTENPDLASVVMEGKCVVVCDKNSLPPKDMIYPYPSPTSFRAKKIAFSAIKNEDASYSNNGGDQSVVKFDYVLVNYGNSYDAITSTFTAKVNGIYSFEFTVFKNRFRYPLTIALTVSILV